MWSGFNERLVIILPSHLVEMIHLTLTRQPVVKIVLSWLQERWERVCAQMCKTTSPSPPAVWHIIVAFLWKCSGLQRDAGRVLQKTDFAFFALARIKRRMLCSQGIRRRKKGGRCVQRFSQLAFSLCTHALILLFSTVPRTAEVRITPSPPFNATDTIHAQIEQ